MAINAIYMVNHTLQENSHIIGIYATILDKGDPPIKRGTLLGTKHRLFSPKPLFSFLLIKRLYLLIIKH